MNRAAQSFFLGPFVLGLAMAAFGACSSDDPGVCDGETCSDQGVCAEADGEAICLCDDGFVADGLSCVAEVGVCDEVDCGDGTCVIDSGEAACLCDDGFVADGLSCVADSCGDVDCSGNGDCAIDENGAAVCVCDDGFVADSTDCLEIPRVTSSSPSNNQQNVDIDGDIVVVFSKSMDVNSVENGLSVTGPTGIISGTTTVRNAGTEATFVPDEPLIEFNSDYVIDLPSSIRDAEGVNLEGSIRRFTTELIDTDHFYSFETAELGPVQVLASASGDTACTHNDFAGNVSGSSWELRDFGVANQFGLTNPANPGLFLEGNFGGTSECFVGGPFAPEPNLNLFTGQRWFLTPVLGHETNCAGGVFPFFFLQNVFRTEAEALEGTIMKPIACDPAQFWRPVRRDPITAP